VKQRFAPTREMDSLLLKQKITKIFVIAFPILMLVMIVQMLPLIIDILRDSGEQDEILKQLSGIGWRAVPALVALSALQVIIPFIPAPAIGILTGLKYGVYWGSAIFLLGFALGSMFVMIYVRKMNLFLGKRRKEKPPKPDSHLKEKINSIRKPEVVAFFFILVPFVSSFGPYLFAKTKVSLRKYIIAVILGNIPSTLFYMQLGRHISAGNYSSAIIIALIALVIIIFAIIFRKRLINLIIDTGK